MNFNPTFGGLTASDFASCVAAGKITASMDERDSLMFDDNEYSRNVTSLDGGTLVGSISLAGSGSLSAFEKPNLRDRKAISFSSKFSSPAAVNPERNVKK